VALIQISASRPKTDQRIHPRQDFGKSFQTRQKLFITAKTTSLHRVRLLHPCRQNNTSAVPYPVFLPLKQASPHRLQPDFMSIRISGCCVSTNTDLWSAPSAHDCLDIGERDLQSVIDFLILVEFHGARLVNTVEIGRQK
jgi:hypothetical protein